MAPNQNGFTDAQQSAGFVSLVLVSPFEEDHSALTHLLGETNWNIRWVQTRQEALDVLRQNRTAVVISECDFPEGNWKDVLRQVQSMTDPPLLIVTSLHADNYLWAEVLNLGGYDVLLKPFHASEVVRVVSLAWQRWKNRGERARTGDLRSAAGEAGQASRSAGISC